MSKSHQRQHDHDLERLCRQYLEGLMDWLYREFRGTIDARDIALHAITNASMNLNQFSGISAKERTWIFSIAKNLALTELRRQGRKRAVHTVSLEEPGVTRRIQGKDGPDRVFQAKVLKRQIWVQVRRLPKRQRLAVALCCARGLTFSQAAERLHLTERQVGYAVKKGLAALGLAVREAVNQNRLDLSTWSRK